MARVNVGTCSMQNEFLFRHSKEAKKKRIKNLFSQQKIKKLLSRANFLLSDVVNGSRKAAAGPTFFPSFLLIIGSKKAFNSFQK